MKNKLPVIIFLLLLQNIQLFAQKEFWGVTTQGGNLSADGYGFGTIFKTDSAGRNPVVVHRFDSINGMKPSAALFQASNGKIYGAAAEGGFSVSVFSGGTLFEYDPVIDSFKTIVYFLSSQFPNRLLPRTAVIEPVTGQLFGSTGGGGIGGCIYKYDINNETVSQVANVPSFQSQILQISNWFNGSLMKASNGLLYGATQQYSSCPDGAPYLGSIARVNLSNNAFNYVYPFNCTYADGANPRGSLVEVGAGKLYGTTSVGGLNYDISQLGDGTLFEYNYLSNTFTKKVDFDTILGVEPSPLTLGPDNKLYGVCAVGGTNLYDPGQHVGTLFQYDPATNIITKKHDFGYDGVSFYTGNTPTTPLLLASNGNLYGMDGPVGIFEYNIVTDTVILKSRWTENADFYGGGPNYGGGLIEICRKPSYMYFYTDSFSVCVNNNFTYTVHSNNAHTYQWNKNNTILFSQTDSTIQFNNIQLSDAGIYTCTMTNECGQTTTMDLVVTVKPLPTVSITSTPASATICQGESIILNGTGAATYTWSGGISNNSSFIPPVGSNTYTVTGTDVNGCSNTNSQIVTVNPLPIVSSTSLPASATICEGENIVLNGNGAITYTWSGGINNNTGFIPPVGTTSYTVTGTDANGCSNTNTQIVVVNPNAIPVISINSNISQGNNGDAVTYTATTNLNNPYVIDWYRNNIFQTATSTNTWNTTIVPGNNAVKAIISSSAQCLQPGSAESNIIEIKPIEGITVYPNPTTNEVMVTGIMPNDDVGLYNSIGQRIITTNGKNILSDQSILSLKNISAGTYILSIKRDEEIITKKIIKLNQ